MTTLRRIKVDSRRGERELRRLARRSATLISARTRRQTRRIVHDVRRRGDKAVLAAVAEHDGVEVEEVSALRMPLWRGSEKEGSLPADLEAAIELSIQAIDRYHAPQVRGGYELDDDGVWLQERRTPLKRVGIYIPGGRFPYFSTVLMTVIPARLAGVEEIVVMTPPRSYRRSMALRHTLGRLQVQEIWGIGGAQAIAAMAYGTESIRRVDKIVGPGNIWVTAAKLLVASDVGTDGVPGPTEVLIFAGEDADAQLVAADLLAQAEHDASAAPILLTTSRRLARRVGEAIEEQLEELATKEVAEQSIERVGSILLVEDLEEGLSTIETIAPEHLQLVGEGPESLLERVRSAAAIFVGASTPEVFGDYLAGPSHVLPTCGTARFASALGVDDFMRRSHCVRFSAEAAAQHAAAAAALADAEGLVGHAAAARRRAT